MWDLSSLTRDGTCVPCFGRQILNHWTTREVPGCPFTPPCLCSCCFIDLQNCMKVLVAQSCPTLCNPTEYSPSGSSVRGISQARIVEWVAIPFSRDLPDTGIEIRSLALQRLYCLSHVPSKNKADRPLINYINSLNILDILRQHDQDFILL